MINYYLLNILLRLAIWEIGVTACYTSLANKALSKLTQRKYDRIAYEAAIHGNGDANTYEHLVRDTRQLIRDYRTI